MKTKSLIETNDYLRDPKKREELISRSVRTSCGVEGIEIKNIDSAINIVHRNYKKIYNNILE